MGGCLCGWLGMLLFVLKSGVQISYHSLGLADLSKGRGGADDEDEDQGKGDGFPMDIVLIGIRVLNGRILHCLGAF